MIRPFLIVIIALLAASTSASGQDYLWCIDSDEILFDLNPQTHTLTIEHRAAMYNCCPQPVSHDLVITEGLISVTEHAGEYQACDCICCFDLKAEVGEIPVGLWTVQFHWREEETGIWTFREMEILVPGDSEGQGPQLLFQEISECLISSGVPDPSEPVSVWGSLKSWYRSSGG